MGMQIVGPKMTIKDEDKQLPFFYLLGPSNGTEAWQPKMCEELKKRITTTDFLVYYPQVADRPGVFPASQYKGDPSKVSQVRLEMDLQKHAGIICPQGCIITWLSLEKTASSENEVGSSVYETARVLGEWMTRIKMDLSVRFVWGGDSHYPGLNELYQAANELYGDEMNLPHYSNLKNLAFHAVQVSFGQSSTVCVKEFLRLPSY